MWDIIIKIDMTYSLCGAEKNIETERQTRFAGQKRAAEKMTEVPTKSM